MWSANKSLNYSSMSTIIHFPHRKYGVNDPKAVKVMRQIVNGNPVALIQWQDLPEFKSTWELFDFIDQQFLIFHLGDKVKLVLGLSIDLKLQKYTHSEWRGRLTKEKRDHHQCEGLKNRMVEGGTGREPNGGSRRVCYAEKNKGGRWRRARADFEIL